MEITIEESQRQAEILKVIQSHFLLLDAGYLQEAHHQMSATLSQRQSAFILNPRPMIAMEQSDLEAAKLKQLKIYIEASKNLQQIINAEQVLAKARMNENIMWDMFK